MSQASQYRRLSDVDFCQREAVALRGDAGGPQLKV